MARSDIATQIKQLIEEAFISRIDYSSEITEFLPEALDDFGKIIEETLADLAKIIDVCHLGKPHPSLLRVLNSVVSDNNGKFGFAEALLSNVFQKYCKDVVIPGEDGQNSPHPAKAVNDGSDVAVAGDAQSADEL